MKENTYYFSHDFHARNDRKLIKAKHKHGSIAQAIYWSLIEMLYEEGGKILMQDCDTIATELRCINDPEIRVFCDILKSIICDFSLFNNDGTYFWSESVNRRLAKRLEKSEKAKASASHRWQNANGMRTHSEGNAIKERKGNKRKGNNIDSAFDDFWNKYGKKVDKLKAMQSWQRLTDDEKAKAIAHVPGYVEATPDPQYRKHPATYLNNKCWQDEGEMTGNVVPMAKKIRAIGINERDQIVYEDGSVVPPGSYNDLDLHKAGKLPLSHFDRKAS